MRRLIISLYFMLSVVMVSGQSKLIYQEQDAKTDLRTFATSEVIVRNGITDRHPMKVSLFAMETTQGWIYSLDIALPELISRAIPKGGILLLRAKSGEVFEVENILSEERSKDWVGQWIEGTASKTYDNRASYRVTREQLEALSSGVLKVRMQLSGEVFDTEYKKDRLGSVIKAHLAALDSGIMSDSNLRSDF